MSPEREESPRRSWLAAGVALLLVISAAVLGRISAPDASGDAASRPSASPSPVTLVRIGGLPMADVDVELTE